MRHKAWFDGSNKPYCKKSSIGGLIYSETGIKIYEFSKKTRFHNCINIVEYKALIHLLHYLIDNKINNVTIYGDCLSVIDQINGNCKVSKKHKKLYRYVKFLKKKIKNCKLEWIPRDQNKEANDLCSFVNRNGFRISECLNREIYNKLIRVKLSEEEELYEVQT